MKATTRIALFCVLLLAAGYGRAQSAPATWEYPWHSASEKQIQDEAQRLRDSRFGIDPQRTYSLAELIDLAESHNPETRTSWERARAQAAALGVVRSELFPALAAAALSQTTRSEVYLTNRFYRQTIQDFDVQLQLNYTIFDFGARRGRIDAARADVLAANFAFNDTHRQVIFRVEEAYYC